MLSFGYLCYKQNYQENIKYIKKMLWQHLIPLQREIDGVQIFIGSENGENPLSDTSMIYAKYGIGEIGQGIIGIVGPTRMDYAALSARLSGFAKGLNKLIAETFYDENK